MDEYTDMKKEINSLKNGILDKMHRYNKINNKIRNKPCVTTEEKMRAREDILEIYNF